MYKLLERLFPICRSITGDGVRKTLDILSEDIDLNIYEVPTNTKVLDWTIPKEWNIKDAYIIDPDGNKICNFKTNNLHIVSYSIPTKEEFTLQQLQKYLYSRKDIPDAIPYITSYYNETWGFCISHNQRQKLKDGIYKVYIDSTLEDGSLTYADIIIPGKVKKEIFISTYICHPSMANNELSGPVLAHSLIKWIQKEPRYYTYRFVFAPETIGAITYIHNNLKELQENIIAAFNLSCVGDDLDWNFMPSRYGNTLTDEIAKKILLDNGIKYRVRDFLTRGSDERQYCSPGINLPMVSIMRSGYGNGNHRYHTSLDNLDYVSEIGLQKSFDIHTKCFNLLENNFKFIATNIGEPQLGKRGLYGNTGGQGHSQRAMNIIHFLAFADGTNNLIDISKILKITIEETINLKNLLLKHKLIKKATIEF